MADTAPAQFVRVRPKLLIVDDEADVRQLLDYNFTASGFDVITVASGDTALRLAERHRPDVILLDILEAAAKAEPRMTQLIKELIARQPKVVAQE